MSSGTNGTAAAVDPLASFPQIPVGNTMGAWLLGSVVATLFLNGLLFHQMYQYFREYSSDRKLLKVWVVSVVILQTVVSALTLHIAYFYMVEKYWGPTYFFLQKPVWSFNALPAVAPMAALVSQMFFVRRVWLFAPKFKIVDIIAAILGVSNVAFFAGLSAKLFKASSVTEASESSRLASVGASAQMTGDVILTFTLIYVLHGSRTGLNKTDSMLEVLIAYAISTGALNTVVHILNVAFSIAWPSNFIYSALSCVLTKLYANTFLVALNTRKFLNGRHVATETMNFRSLSAMCSGTLRPTDMPAFQHDVTSDTVPTTIELKVHKEVKTDYDDSRMHSKAEHISSVA